MNDTSVRILDAQGRPMSSVYTGAGAGFGNQLVNWNPMAQTADAALLPTLKMGNARADDLARNHGIASNGVQLHVDNIVGHLFRLSYKPRWQRLGMSEEDAASLARDVEQAWTEYAEDDVHCYLDAERKRTFTMLIREGIATHTTKGEIMASAEWEYRPGSLFKTCIKTITPHRVSNPHNLMDTNRLRGGVNVDRYGAARSYNVRDTSVPGYMFGDGMGSTWREIPRETSWGREQFLHVFEPTEDGQTRGANRFLAVMEQMHMLGKLQHTKLQNAIVNAMYAAVIESEMDSSAAFEIIGGDGGEDVLQKWMMSMLDYHAGANIRMNGVKIPHLMPGEKLNLMTSSNADNGFAELEASILRWIAAGLNVPFEALARDYSKTTYSSARASMLDGWRYFMGRRKVIAARFATKIFALWLEEAFSRGVIVPPKGAKSFYDGKASWCNCAWIGSGRVAIDGLKEVKEAVLRIDSGLSTYEKELALMGEDYQEIFQQQIREVRERQEAGLPPPSWMRVTNMAPDEREAA
ncbi:phage portal protein, lambda family [Hahella chejuensis KCTC 2396]|uniref:Phage portal protein, lambda family n=1 Tax=Hahella chejuensis (strain KCTC 2396) TaxID=349521 RepID=Q2SI55_HAHCH|nr:phage portal protein [Hahella chejuensis]ABC29669.1 phage portal protein, lambda family [Hahella chejuensis KCTC 2396]